MWEPILKEAGTNIFIAYDVNNPLFKIIETVDKNSDYIEVGWANLVQPGVDVFDIYKFYYQMSLIRYEMTLGFRVWSKWRVPAPSVD